MLKKLLGNRLLGLPAGLVARYLGGVISLSVLLMVFTAATGHGLRLKYEVIGAIGDSALIMSPVFLLPRRWRWTALIPVAVLAIYLVGCEGYYRYWGNMLPLTSVFSSANWNGFVIGSLPQMFSVCDAVMLLVPVTYGVGLYLLGKAERKAGRDKEDATVATRLLASAASFAVWVLIFAISLIQNRGYLRSVGSDCSAGAVVSYRFRPASSLYDNWNKGLPVYLYLEARNLAARGNRHTLTDDERALLDTVLAPKEKSGVLPALSDNKDKNLIFIIVESLNADIVGKEYGGRSVTPVLDSLLRMPGTVAALNVASQIGDGGSSDGQMIYNTGLLPVFHGCTAQLYASSSSFPSLAKTLGKCAAEEYIVEEGRVWAHNETTKAYGYDHLNDAAELERLDIDPTEIGGDRAVFRMALRKMKDLKRPFMAEIVTLSMHFPYNDPGVPRQKWIDDLEGLQDSERNYIQMTSYFDKELGCFLEELDAAGLYDNSVIVIASDHDQIYKDVGEVASSRNVSPIVFMALNTGVTAYIGRPAKQMDVYPTVLDIMGYDGDGYRGLGQSLLSDDVSGRVTEEEIRMASDLIIRSDFFGPGEM